MTRRLILTLAGITLASATAFAQGEAGLQFEHLKGYQPFVGKWRYEGPFMEEVPGLIEEDANCVIEVTRRWILDKNAIEEKTTLEIVGGRTFHAQSLIGWNASEQTIVKGGMDSLGGVGLGTAVIDSDEKSVTITSEGVDAEGEETSTAILLTKTGKDTLEWQATQRTGGLLQGPSPVYTFKRVPRGKKPVAKKIRQPKRIMELRKPKVIQRKVIKRAPSKKLPQPIQPSQLRKQPPPIK